MKTREPIQMTDSTMDMVMKMSEGNPGAATAIGQLIKDDPAMGVISILSLDDMGIRGPQIWVAFKDYCKGDIAAFKQAIRDRDSGMVAMVNQRCPDHRAVTSGASFA